MKDIICGKTTYRINTAFGVLNELEKGIFEAMDDEVLKKVANKSTMKDLEDSPIGALFGQDPDALRTFLNSNIDQANKMLIAVLREVVTPEGTITLDVHVKRVEYVMTELDYADGVKILAEVQDLLQAGQEARGERRGKSTPSSEKAVTTTH